jgi:hypothetical protein
MNPLSDFSVSRRVVPHLYNFGLYHNYRHAVALVDRVVFDSGFLREGVRDIAPLSER